MIKQIFWVGLAVAAMAVSAAPAQKEAPVAAGFPAWQGLSDKDYICGRPLTPSELRQRVTIVVVVEPGEKLEEQLLLVSPFALKASLNAVIGHGTDWEHLELPRDVVMVVSVRNATHKQILDVIEKKGRPDKEATAFVSMRKEWMGWSFYDNVTFPGAPDNDGKLPFFYVMGPTGMEPICKGDLTAEDVRKGEIAVNKAKSEMAKAETKWRPFFGTVAEPKFNTSLAKTLEKGKKAKKAPLAPVEKALLADVVSKDSEKATEAQILYDALIETRNLLVFRINLEVGGSPYRAYYDIQELLKYWPTEAKRLEKAQARFKALPEAASMGKIYMKLVEWEDPSFTCKNAGEAKKILAELGKMKKALAGPKENAKNIAIQDCALLLDTKVDTLISAMKAQAEAK